MLHKLLVGLAIYGIYFLVCFGVGLLCYDLWLLLDWREARHNRGMR
jgi:hypothetical protein